jgi:hypothetical protein
MRRGLTAAALAVICAVGLAAQTTGTAGTPTQDPQTATAGGGQGRGGGPRTVTGCLRAGDTEGTYTLTNVEGMGGRMGGGAAAGDTTAGGVKPGSQGRAMAMSITLNPEASVDLKPHIGHKIEVTGTFAGRGGRRGGGMAGGAASATGGESTAAAPNTGSTAAGQAGAAAGRQGRGMRAMTVTSLKMISASCS